MKLTCIGQAEQLLLSSVIPGAEKSRQRFPKREEKGIGSRPAPLHFPRGWGLFPVQRTLSPPFSPLFPFEPHLFTFLTLLLTFSCRFFLILLLKSVMDDHQIIERVFERLSPNYRACLWLHEYEGLSCLEIGERLRISKGAVKMRLQRGREQFLTLYREETGE